MTRAWLRTVARGLIGVLFAAQMAIAAYACPALSAAAAAPMQLPTQQPAPDQAGEARGGMSMADGCDDMVGSMDPASPNLCAEHCKAGQQSDKASTLNVPAAVLSALYATPFASETVPPPRLAAASVSALVAASPPHAILHCVHRI